MKTILVDDELWAMDKFEIEAGAIPDIEIAGKFDRSEEALQFAKENRVDFALLDVEMPGMNGLELSQALKKLYPDMVIIFVSGYDQYVLDALKHGADYYITKPYSSQQVIDILKRARLLSARQEKPVYIRTFGAFEVFVDKKKIKFPGPKVKEIFALLVDKNGGGLTSEEALAVKWEGKEYTDANLSLYRNAARRLADFLESIGIGGIMITEKNVRWLDTELYDCDYNRFLAGDENAFLMFQGEYMTNYSWGETTLGRLSQMKNEKFNPQGVVLTLK